MAKSTTPTTVPQFLELARASGLLDTKALAAQFPGPHDLPDDAPQCAAALVRAKLLTPFQAKSLLAGRHRGFVLGPYRVLEPIGKGGMGVVYLAEHSTLRRRVAVKVLPKEEAEDKLNLHRFYREARAAAALDHPNIVRLHDISQAAGVHFLVMEYVNGTTLDGLVMKTGPLHYAQAVEYVAQAAAGLAHAHSRGFIHRDVKPANIMVTKLGVVKILDMGLARAAGNSDDSLTGQLGNGAVAGTIDYISPEQALNGDVDARSDVYSLGATLYALIAGKTPYSGSTAQKLIAHQTDEPPRLGPLKVNAPAGLSNVIETMMAKRPEDRYQSAEAVIAALAPWLPETPSSTALGGSMSSGEYRAATSTNSLTARTRPSGIRLPTSKPRSLKKWLVLGGLAVVVLALGGLAAAYFGGAFAQKPNPSASVRRDWPVDSLPTPPVVKTTEKTVFDLNLGDGGPMTITDDFSGKPKRTGPGKLPTGWSFSRTGGEAKVAGEYRAFNENDRWIIALRRLSGTAGVQFAMASVADLAAGKRYLLRLEYKGDADLNGMIEVRKKFAEWTIVPCRVPLGPTDGAWRSVEAEIVPTEPHPAIIVIQIAPQSGSQNGLQFRALSIVESVLPGAGP